MLNSANLKKSAHTYAPAEPANRGAGRGAGGQPGSGQGALMDDQYGQATGGAETKSRQATVAQKVVWL